MLISFAVTAKLICVIFFAYAKVLFSHDKTINWTDLSRKINVNFCVFHYQLQAKEIAVGIFKKIDELRYNFGFQHYKLLQNDNGVIIAIILLS